MSDEQPDLFGEGQSNTQFKTHHELVGYAVKWLYRTCSIVATEIATSGETPDAIGFNNHISTLIECKVSREDFKRDSKKHFRINPEKGMGMYRYFSTEIGLVPAEKIPDKWGLIVVTGKRMRLIKKAEFQESNEVHEKMLLVSLIRRLGSTQPTDACIKFYSFPPGKLTTVHVQEGGENNG